VYCSSCGQNNNSGDRFCLNCGMQIEGKPRKQRRWILPVAIMSISLVIVSVLLIALPRGGACDQYGNTDGNLKNGGITAEQGDWIYYVAYNWDNHQCEIKRIRKDGTGRETIAECKEDTPFFLNVIDDWIYFSSETGIYKISTDGSHLTRLADIQSTFLTVINDQAYFWEFEEDEDGYYCRSGSLYRMKTDGSGITKLRDGDFSLSVTDEWIYYVEEGCLYKIKTDGSKKTLLSQDIWLSRHYGGWLLGLDLIVSGDWLYYISISNEDRECICKVRSDGSDKQILAFIEHAECFNVVGEWIYYNEWNLYEDSCCLYKIRTDGSEKTKILEEDCYLINIAGDWIYYFNDDQNDWYRIRTDGSVKERVQ